MKRRFILRIAALALAIVTLTGVAHAADYYYVVVGAFANEMNARRFTTDILSHFSNATYSFNAERNLFYVYVLKTSKKTTADERSHYLKTYKGFKDVWVLADHTDALERHDAAVTEGTITTAQPKNRETTAGIAAGTRTSDAVHTPRYEGTGFSKGTGPLIASAASGGNYLEYDEPAEARAAQLTWTTTSGLSFASGIDNPTSLAESEVGDRIFTFVVENSEGKAIDAEVMLVDYERVKRIAGFRTGENVAIRGAKRGQMVTLVCDVLGYGQETHRYNIDQLSRGRDIRKNEQGVWEVRFKLAKMELNEIAFLNKTTFHTDAAVLKASSRDELDELAELMLDNPSYKIIIHSHCNRGDRREINMPAEERYFDIEAAVAMTGSDKKLTKARATIVKEYLVSKGIESKRIGVVGWGSLEPIASPSGPDADLNERIEFELAQE